METRKTETRERETTPSGALLESAAIDRAAAIAADAYVYGYPLVLMDVTRRVATAVPRREGAKAPINQFAHLRAFPDPTFTDVVGPNADTLYSTAWLDLAREPIVLSLPEVRGRYYLMPLLDAWTNVFASLGTRTTGGGPGQFVVVGPHWAGRLPVEIERIASPTNMVWLIGRTETRGKADYAAVHAIQDRFRLTPLSAWGKAHTPPDTVPFAAGVDMKTPPTEQVARMDAATFFSRLNALMVRNPPALADAGMLRSFAAIGVAPGKGLGLESLGPDVAQGLERGVAAARAKLRAEAGRTQGKMVNGWEVKADLGCYWTDYSFRAVVALGGLGANLPDDALYPHARVDFEGWPLNGANRYVVHFAKGQLPPVNAFWSLTLYNPRQAFVENPIGRYALGDRDGLTFNGDGSLTLQVQRGSPGAGRESNWLPAPAGPFHLVLRLYWPRPAILSGKWKMPPIERVS